MASYLTELLIQGSPQLTLEHASDIMDRPELTLMEKPGIIIINMYQSGLVFGEPSLPGL